MTAQIIEMPNEAERRWRAYLAARDVAERSRDFRDGIAAGRAWAEFMEIFVGGERAHG